MLCRRGFSNAVQGGAKEGLTRAKNTLTGGSELPQEPNNIEGRLAVETRCGLVKEEQELRLGSQLDTDGESLPGLDAETETGETDESIGEILEFTAGEGEVSLAIRVATEEAGQRTAAEESPRSSRLSPAWRRGRAVGGRQSTGRLLGQWWSTRDCKGATDTGWLDRDRKEERNMVWTYTSCCST